jgi:DNA ligase-1
VVGHVYVTTETLALNDDGRPRPFQETMSRFGATSERELLLSPYFFDCMHLDGTDLIDAPLRERNAALHKAVGDLVIPGPLGQSHPRTNLRSHHQMKRAWLIGHAPADTVITP